MEGVHMYKSIALFDNKISDGPEQLHVSIDMLKYIPDSKQKKLQNPCLKKGNCKILSKF